LCAIKEIEIDRGKKKMKEGRGKVVMALGMAHWGKSLKYLKILK
jgi:hypothetical protein